MNTIRALITYRFQTGYTTDVSAVLYKNDNMWFVTATIRGSTSPSRHSYYSTKAYKEDVFDEIGERYFREKPIRIATVAVGHDE